MKNEYLFTRYWYAFINAVVCIALSLGVIMSIAIITSVDNPFAKDTLFTYPFMLACLYFGFVCFRLCGKFIFQIREFGIVKKTFPNVANVANHVWSYTFKYIMEYQNIFYILDRYSFIYDDLFARHINTLHEKQMPITLIGKLITHDRHAIEYVTYDQVLALSISDIEKLMLHFNSRLIKRELNLLLEYVSVDDIIKYIDDDTPISIVQSLIKMEEDAQYMIKYVKCGSAAQFNTIHKILMKKRAIDIISEK